MPDVTPASLVAPTDTVFRYTREPDPAWVAALAAVSPPSEHVSHLHLVWEAGDPWEPGQRWVLYELYPLHATDPVLLADCRGPNPRERAYYDQVTRQFVADPNCLVTQTQWRLYRETGRYGQPFWIVQGTKGGHKRWFNRTEQKLCKMAGLPPEPPSIGDLPYADPDGRTWAQLRAFDRLQAAGNDLRQLQGDAHVRRKRDQQERLRADFVRWLEAQVDDHAKDYAQAVPTEDARRVETDFSREWEETQQDFIERGAF
jgi:hypothetical protein